jgi:PKHD-type hydroxylase
MINKTYVFYMMEGCAPCAEEMESLSKYAKHEHLPEGSKFIIANINDESHAQWKKLLQPKMFPTMYCLDSASLEILHEHTGFGGFDRVMLDSGVSSLPWLKTESKLLAHTGGKEPLLYAKKPEMEKWFKLKRQVFSPEECDKIVSHMGSRELFPAQVGGGAGNVDSNVRRSNIAWIGNDELPWLSKGILDAVGEVNKEYFHFDLDGMYEMTQYTTYDGTDKGFYDKHMDYTITTVSARKLSIIVLLTDQDEYTGGEIEIHEGLVPDIWKVSKGDAIIFPSFMLHKVRPVESGHRISLVQWVHGPDFR